MQATRLIRKILIFLVLNAGLLAAVLWFFSGQYRHLHLDNGETESNLLVMGDNGHYALALLGTSRGRVFSRDNNHQMLENILGQKVINLSKGGGGGLMPAELHLSFFYYRGNRADHIVYLVDPWVFFSAINNEKNNFFLRNEPFELFILWKLMIQRYPSDQISSYLQKITVKDWPTISKYEAPGLTEGRLKVIDQKKLDKARQHYLSKYGENAFEKYSRFVDIINALVKRNSGRITYVMLPMLIPDFPGMAQVDQKLKEAARRNGHVAYYNLSDTMQDRQFFYDHMHFNKAGIAYFARNVLSPIVHGGAPNLE
jgi:hypothetical protein